LAGWVVGRCRQGKKEKRYVNIISVGIYLKTVFPIGKNDLLSTIPI
jgi:hypothetical protein